jgi:hypothetical protein
VQPPIDPQLAAREELATPLRYHLQAAPPPTESLWERLLDAIDNLLSKLFGIHAASGVGNALVFAALIVAVALALYMIVRLTVIAPRRRAAAVRVEELVAERTEFGLARQAFAAAGLGEFVTAIRLLLRATVAMLDLRGTLRDDASATIGELRREAKQFGESVAAPFGTIASAYVRAVYARRPVDEQIWVQARDAYERLRGTR